MENDNVKTAFDKAAKNYDKHRHQAIPLMDVYYNTAIELTENFTNPKILDLGAGTGLLSELLHKLHPKSEITLLDFSDEMLTNAKRKFQNIPQFKYQKADYLEDDFQENYDIIISSLSIHHLTDEEKQVLYKKIYNHLNVGGVFINADEVKGATQKTEKMYKDKENTHLEKQDMIREEKDELLKRRQLDKPATMLDTIKWYEEIGFKNVDIFYKYYRYFVICGER